MTGHQQVVTNLWQQMEHLDFDYPTLPMHKPDIFNLHIVVNTKQAIAKYKEVKSDLI